MAPRFSGLSWLPWSRKSQEPSVANGLFSSPRLDAQSWNPNHVKSLLDQTSSLRLTPRKKQMRIERKEIDRELNIILVPTDDGCVSGSESDSDYSVGWLEPLGPEFQNEDGRESFAVLVPCYSRQPQDDIEFSVGSCCVGTRW